LAFIPDWKKNDARAAKVDTALAFTNTGEYKAGAGDGTSCSD